jgi:hypothetical protein
LPDKEFVNNAKPSQQKVAAFLVGKNENQVILSNENLVFLFPAEQEKGR